MWLKILCSDLEFYNCVSIKKKLNYVQYLISIIPENSKGIMGIMRYCLLQYNKRMKVI